MIAPGFVLFGLFFISGFCGLVYQIVWLRAAFAAYGVITPVISVILAVFMGGLSLGSWGGGRFVERAGRGVRRSPMLFYSACELTIAIGAFTVPALFTAGERYLLTLGAAGSASYLFLSAALITASLLPWCVCMGATFPFAMAYMRNAGASTSSFSFLYLANVLGATGGAALTVVLVEVLGFHGTLRFAAGCNLLIAAASLAIGMRDRGTAAPGSRAPEAPVRPPGDLRPARWTDGVLFLTGFCSLAMEVVWTRAFTPVTKTTIYAFALLLATYLAATAAGAFVYRRDRAHARTRTMEGLLGFLAVSAFLPLLVSDPRLSPTVVHVVVGLVPLCAALGYLTPLLIDQGAAGSPDRAGRVYAINILGCVLGPLVAGYLHAPAAGSEMVDAALERALSHPVPPDGGPAQPLDSGELPGGGDRPLHAHV